MLPYVDGFQLVKEMRLRNAKTVTWIATAQFWDGVSAEIEEKNFCDRFVPPDPSCEDVLRVFGK